MRRLRAFTIATVVLPVALLASSCVAQVGPPVDKPAAPVITPEQVGFNAEGIGPYADVDRTLEDVAATGAKWIRVDFSWATVQQTRTFWNWDPTDHLVTKANSLGLHILGLITYTPSWEGTLPTPTDYGAYASAVSARYASQGVHAWEIWNEANLKGPWPGAPDPVLYVKLLKAAYVAIHANDTDAVVVSTGLSPAPDSPGYGYRPATFLKAMYDNGAKGYFDAVGLHITMTPFPINCRTCNQIWNLVYSADTEMYPLMQAEGDGNMKIWATEAGYSTTIDPTKGVTESQQGPYLVQLLDAWLHKPYAGPVFTYVYRDPGTDVTNWFDMMGLVRYDFSHKPAFDVLKSYISSLSN